MIAIVPLKKESIRVPNKNFKKFGNTRLVDLKIKTLLKVKGIDRIIINTDSDEVIQDLVSYDVDFVKRDSYYTTCSGSEFFENIAINAPDDVLIYTPVTAPFVKASTLQDAIDIFNRGRNDSVVSVTNIQDHVWYRGEPVNYDPQYTPNSHELHGLYLINYGFGIHHRSGWIERRNIIGSDPMFYELTEIEAIDIDTPLEFEFAKYIYENGIYSM